MGDAGLEELRGQPLDFAWHGGAAGGYDGQSAAGLGHRLVVGGPQRRRCELGVAQGHLGGDVPEQRHERLQGHPGVGQAGGVGVAQPVRGDPRGVAGVDQQSGGSGGAVQPGADPPGTESASLGGEQKVGGSAGLGVWDRALLAAGGGPGVERGDGGVVEQGRTVRSAACPVGPAARCRPGRSPRWRRVRGRAARPGAARRGAIRAARSGRKRRRARRWRPAARCRRRVAARGAAAGAGGARRRRRRAGGRAGRPIPTG